MVSRGLQVVVPVHGYSYRTSGTSGAIASIGDFNRASLLNSIQERVPERITIYQRFPSRSRFSFATYARREASPFRVSL